MRDDWLDKEPRSPIIQAWSNPLYNLDPLRISYLEEYNTNLPSSEDSRRVSTEETVKKKLQSLLVGEEKREVVEPKDIGMGTTTEDASLKLPVFHGMERDDAKQH